LVIRGGKDPGTIEHAAVNCKGGTITARISKAL
jgi:hypothetical protein